MNKKWFVILLIFLIPLCVYWGLTRDKVVMTQPSEANIGMAEIIKFSSPMCGECQEFEKIVNDVYPHYSSDIMLKKVDITQHDATTTALIKQYKVKLVPTTIIKTKNGKVLRQFEGAVSHETLETYIKEAING